MSYNSSNVRLVVQVAQKFSENLGVDKLIELFEEFSSTEGLFYFLGAIAYTSTDGNVQLKFIEAATKMGQSRRWSVCAVRVMLSILRRSRLS